MEPNEVLKRRRPHLNLYSINCYSIALFVTPLYFSKVYYLLKLYPIALLFFNILFIPRERMAQAHEVEVTMLPAGILVVEASTELGRVEFTPIAVAQAVREGARCIHKGVKIMPLGSKVGILSQNITIS